MYLLLFPLFIYGQNGNLRLTGKVIDQDSHLPISGASVHLVDSDLERVSDPHGFFSIDHLQPGTYQLQIRSLGFKTTEMSIELESNSRITIEMDHQGVILHDVEVLGHQNKLKTTGTVRSLNEAALRETRGEVLAEALKNVPGVSMLQTGSTIAKPVIQGMHSNRVVLVNNGIKQQGQQWGSEHAPEIDPFIASEIHVIKGADGVRYGAEAIGGVIIVEPAPLPIEDKLQGKVNLIGSSNGRTGTGAVMLQGGVPKLPGLSWRAQGSLKQGGNIRTPDYYLENTGMNETNYSAALTYRRQGMDLELYYSRFDTELGIFKGAHIGSISDLEQRIRDGRPSEEGSFSYAIDVPRQNATHHLLKVKGHRDLKNGGTFDVQYGWQKNLRQEYDLRRGGRDAIPAMDLQLNAHTLDLIYSRLNSNSLRTTIGVQGSNTINNNLPGTFVTPLIPNYDSFGIGAFIIERKVYDQITLEAGLRYDYKTLNAAGYDKDQNWYGGIHHFSNVSGSLGATLQLSGSSTLQSNLGLAWRPPTVSELYSNGLHHGSASIEMGNSDLESERGLKWINTFSIHKDRWSMDIDAYAHYLNRYIYLNPTGEFEESLRGAFPVFAYQQTNALYLGLDVQGSYSITPWIRYELKAAALRARDIQQDQFLPDIPSARMAHQIRWSLPFGQALEGTYLEAGVRSVFRQGLEPIGEFAPPPETYHLMHLSAGTQWVREQQTLSLNISVDNLMNTLYKEYMNRFRYYAHDRGRNITLRLAYEF